MNKKKFVFSEKICAELDLHMLTKSQAEIELYDFLEKASSLGFRKIRIITGRGLHSENKESILKPFIENILKREKLKFCNAKMNRGGTGAIEVNLY